MNEHKRIARRAEMLPANTLSTWEQGVVAGIANPAFIEAIAAKVVAWEQEYGPLELRGS